MLFDASTTSEEDLAQEQNQSSSPGATAALITASRLCRLMINSLHRQVPASSPALRMNLPVMNISDWQLYKHFVLYTETVNELLFVC